MAILTINQHKIELPTSWNSFTKKQILRMADYIAKFDITYFKVLQMLEIVGLKSLKQKEVSIDNEECFFFKINKDIVLLSANDIKFISNFLSFLFKEITEKENVKYIVNSKLSKNLIPHFRFKHSKYYGPADALTNLLFSEYIHALTNYVRYCKTQETQYLDKLITILYRKKKPLLFIKKKLPNYNGDIRKKFNDHFIEKNSKKFQKLHHKYKLSILWFFEGSLYFLQRRFPFVFNGEGSGNDTEIFESFLRLTDKLARQDPTKNKEIRNTYLYEIMINLDEAGIKYEKELEYYEKLKSNR